MSTSTSFVINKLDMSHNTDKIHSHRNYELNYILNGVGRRFIGGSIERYVHGDLVLIGPNLPHCWEVKGVAEGLSPECITIHFHENFFGQNIIQSPELKPMYDLLMDSGLGIQFFG